jgi:hypothetical protein
MSAQIYVCHHQAIDIADIRNYVGQSANELIFMYGPVYPQNAGFAKKFLWDGASTATDDGTTVLQPTSVGGAGRWIFQEFETDHPQLCADWNASGNNQEILNKPTIPAAPGTPAASGGLALATAFQAANNAKQAFITLILESTSTSTLLASTMSNEASIYIDSTNGVATTGGTKVGTYKNDVANTLALGLTTTQKIAQSISFVLPVGWYYAIRQTAGTGISVTDKCEATIG